MVQVTIAPRAGRELGYVRMKMDPIKFKEGMLTYDFLCIPISLVIFQSTLKRELHVNFSVSLNIKVKVYI